MDVDCLACKAKDKHIEYLEKLVDDLISPYKQSNQVFIPKYINDNGEIIEMVAEDGEGRESYEGI